MNCATCNHHLVDVDVGITRRDRLCAERNASPDVLVYFAAGPDEDAGCPWWQQRQTREAIEQMQREDVQRWADAEVRQRRERLDRINRERKAA